MDEINVENIADYKLNKVCRLCSAIKFYLMTISSNGIITMIKECAPVNVSIGDNLPQFICQECFNLLEKIVTFRRICIESEIKFLKSYNTEKDECDKPLFYKTETNSDQNVDSANDSDQNEIAIENIEDIKIDIEHPKQELTPNVSDCDNNDLPDMEFSDSDSEPLIKFKKVKAKPKKRYGKDRLRNYKCEICSNGKEYTWKGIIYHMKHCHTVEPLKCKYCPKKFYYEPQWKSHEQKHELFKCNHCHQGFPTRITYQKHLSTNPSHKKHYSCSLCVELFETKTILREHERKIHNKRKKIKKAKAECPVCHKIFDKHNLKTHQWIHGTRSRLNCPNCPKTFYHQISLNLHQRKVHEPHAPIEEVKNYLCNLCGKATTNKSYLERHLAAHSTDRPFKCDKCPNAYKQPASLKTHINNTHLNLRPYVCSVCGLGFFSNRTLENHIRTHTGEKPFKCKVCEQACFGSKAGLYLHMQAHHVTKPPVLNMFKFIDST